MVRIAFATLVCAVGLWACGESNHVKTDTNYDDPSSTYVPPDYRQEGGKADFLSPNPFIRQVEWMPQGQCDATHISPMILKFKVEDHDTSMDDLVFEGTVSGCNPVGRSLTEIINSDEVVVMCHHVSNHDGMVIVRDPDGHVDSVLFTFGPCARGSAKYRD